LKPPILKEKADLIMSKGLLTIIIITCALVLVGSFVYTIYNYLKTNKKNRAAERTNEQLFLAETQRILNQKKAENANSSNSAPAKTVPTYISNPIIKEPPKAVDYDTIEEEVVDTNLKLKDFFKAD
jgi:flagellar basal body-associated protein FliL